MARQVPWLRVFVEGIVIVASILLAFGIEAWWQDRQQRLAELEALERLDRALLQVDQALIAWRANHQGVEEASEILLEHTGPPGTSNLTADSVGTLLAPIAWAWTIDLSDVTLSAFESSGQLGTLQNQELLDALTSWRAIMADLQGDERVAEESVYRDLVPFLNSHASWVTIDFLDQGLVAEAMEPPRRSRFPSGLTELLANREFENLLEGRRTAAAGAVDVYDAARESLGRVRQLIGHELDR